MTLNKSYLENILYDHYLKNDQNILSINPGEGHDINSKNFRILLKTGEGFYLKVVDEFNADTKTKIRIINECYHDNIKVPEIIENKQGEITTIKKNKLFLLMKYCERRRFSFKLKEIHSAGENLAVLNEKLDKIKTVLKRKDFYDDLSGEDLEKIKNKIDKKESFNKKVHILCEKLPRLYHRINDMIQPYENKKQLVHLDYHTQNVLFKNNQVLVILDFDSILTSLELQSVAFACDRFSKDINGFITFIKGYQSHGRNFTSDELKILPYFAEKEAVCRINYILRRHFFFNDTTWSFELDKHLKILKRMQYVENELKNIILQ